MTDSEKTKLEKLQGLVLQLNIKLMKQTNIRSSVSKYSDTLYFIAGQINAFEQVKYCVGYDEIRDEYFWSSHFDFSVRMKDMGDL